MVNVPILFIDFSLFYSVVQCASQYDCNLYSIQFMPMANLFHSIFTMKYMIDKVTRRHLLIFEDYLYILPTLVSHYICQL